MSLGIHISHRMLLYAVQVPACETCSTASDNQALTNNLLRNQPSYSLCRLLSALSVRINHGKLLYIVEPLVTEGCIFYGKALGSRVGFRVYNSCFSQQMFAVGQSRVSP